MADILKVDWKLTTLEERAALVKKHGPWRCRMPAEKVENHAEFVAARDQGFIYFQGYFLRRPEIMTTHEIPANRVNYVRMLQAVSRALVGRAGDRQAHQDLAILGDRELRRWVRLFATVGAGQDRTSDLVLCALVRARFGELLAPLTRHDDYDLFPARTALHARCHPGNAPCPRCWRRFRWIPKPRRVAR
jgi:EAL and modified HD-GYP domain-containing signal transduction protein